MTLHLVRLPLDLRALAAFAVANRASDDDDGYALHLALRGRFGAAGPQPFRVLPEQPRDRGGPQVLGYVRDKDAFADAAGLPVTDDRLGKVFPQPLEAPKPMPETWREGARFAFEVRVRPVVRFGGKFKELRAASDLAGQPENWWARSGEVDAWIAARTRPAGDPSITREAAYRAWLIGRVGGAAALDDVELRQGRRVRTRRSTHGRPGRARVEGPEAVMAGVLTIRDPAGFAALLARGVGRHAAFGYGMLLLSPPRR